MSCCSKTMAHFVDVYFIIDDSGSMSAYERMVRSAVKEMVSVDRNTDKTKYTYHFIGFSESAVISNDIDALPFQGSSTDIVSAFNLLKGHAMDNRRTGQGTGQEPLTKYIIVFVSDGMDNDPSTVNARLSQLGRFTDGKVSVLFAVAVGDGFPTKMVIESLRPNYHNASDCLPMVFPLRCPEETCSVFANLAHYVFKCDHFRETLDFDETSTLEDLQKGVDAVYNYYILKSAQEHDASKSRRLLEMAKFTLHKILKLVDQLDGKVAKPLASILLVKNGKQRCKTLVLDAITKVNAYIDQAVKGQLLAKLSDPDKQKALAYGNVAGKHLAKSIKYHSADFAKTVRSLADCLRNYDASQAAADSEVSDGVVTQAEAMLDAQGCADALVESAESLIGLLELLPVVGRLLQVETCSGTQINPFLVRVVSMPTVLQHSNTVDFFTLFRGAYASRGETANCLLPITRNASPKSLLRLPCGAHLATFLLCRNVELRFATAQLALQAAVVTHCLENHGPGWIDGVLDETYESYRCVYGGHGIATEPGLGCAFRAYMKVVAGPDFRLALVTSSDALPAECTCEHLTKYVLAVYVLIREGRSFSADELLERMKAAVVETVGRGVAASGQLIDHFSSSPLHGAAELLGRVPRAEALASHTEAGAVRAFEAAVCAAVRADAPECGLAHLGLPDDVPGSYFQFSRSALSRIFAALNRLAGNGEVGSERFDLPDQADRLALLQRGYVAGSLARNAAPGPAPALDEAFVRSALVQKHVRGVRSGAAAFIRELYGAQQRAVHRVLLPLPPSYIKVGLSGFPLPLTRGYLRCCGLTAVQGGNRQGCGRRLCRKPGHLAPPPRLRRARLPALPRIAASTRGQGLRRGLATS